MSKSSVKVWPAASSRFAAFRLPPQCDLRLSLERLFAASGHSAGFVITATGSLSKAQLRLAGSDDITRAKGPFEIIHVSGTLGPQGPHLHIGLATAKGRMVGGHLLHGCIIATTCEVVLGLTSEVSFTRAHDETTGHAELALS